MPITLTHLKHLLHCLRKPIQNCTTGYPLLLILFPLQIPNINNHNNAKAKGSHNYDTPSAVNGYLLPLDIDIDVFLQFGIAGPVNEATGKNILEFRKIKYQIWFPVLCHKEFPSIHTNIFNKPSNPLYPEWNHL